MKILVQSPKDILVKDLLKAVPLVCIANTHGSCSYNWQCISDRSRKFGSVPVLFVIEPGLYQCSVEFHSKEIKSHCMRVSIQPC